jgi:multiple sugar transport system permease protein
LGDACADLLSIWKQLGFNMVVFLAGLQTIPVNRYEAAERDGLMLGSSWQSYATGLQTTLGVAAMTTVIFTPAELEQCM